MLHEEITERIVKLVHDFNPGCGMNKTYKKITV